MSKYVYIVGFLFCIGGLAAWQSNDTDPLDDAVIKVADQFVTVDEFRSSYSKYLADTGLLDDRQRRSAFASRLVGIELVAKEAADRGADSDPEVMLQTETARQNLLVRFFLERTVFADLTPSENEMREMFVRVNTSVKARHLFATDLEAAQELRGRLEAGESFEELAREVFDDPVLVENGGSVGYFGFDEMDPAFEDAAFSMSIGEVSQPVRTAFGYSIIEVEDIRIEPILTETEYANKKDRMWQYVSYRKRIDARQELAESILADLNPTLVDNGLEAVFSIIEGRTQIESTELSPEIDGMTVVEFDPRSQLPEGFSSSWTIGQFRAYAEHTSAKQREAVKSKEALGEFVKGLVVRQVLLARAKDGKLDREPEFRRAFSRAISDIHYERGYRHLTNRVTVPEDSVRMHFEQNRSSFVSKPTILVYEILTASADDAARAIELLRTASFESVASSMSIRPGAADSGGRLGYVVEAQLGALGGRLFSAPVNETIGPIEIDGHFGIFQVREHVAANQATFEEVEGEIRAYLQNQVARNYLRAHVDSLRTVYPVVVDEGRIQELRLTKDS